MDGGGSALSSPLNIIVEPLREEVEGSRVVEESLVIVPVVEVVRPFEDPFLTGVPFLGTSSFNLSMSINLFTNSLEFTGLEWVENLIFFNDYFTNIGGTINHICCIF